jgi:hypothetical protein
MTRNPSTNGSGCFRILIDVFQIIGAVAGVFSVLIAIIAFFYAVRNPERVDQMILVLAGVTPSPGTANSTATQTFIPVTSEAIEAVTANNRSIIPQPVGFVFKDDFERGIDPAWEGTSDKLGMANGTYTVVSLDARPTRHVAILNDYYWGNVSIIVNLEPLSSNWTCSYPCDVQPYAGIIIRHQSDRNDIGLLLQPTWDGIAFGTLDRNGEWVLYAGSLVEGDEFGGLHGGAEIKVEAYGNTYFAFVNGRQITSAQIPGPTIGQVGLWFQSADSSAPGFDDFTVESLP